jgi:colicin import membrane protein
MSGSGREGAASMSAFEKPRDQKKFERMLIVSGVLHLLLLVGFIIANRPNKRDFKTQEAIQTQLVRLGQDRPEWLPRLSQPPPPKQAPVPIADSAKAVDTKTHAKEDNKSKFDDALKRLEDLERKADDDYKGKGSADGSKHGTVSDITKQTLGNIWVGEVQERIRPNLSVPTAIPESERASLKVVVLIMVAPNGKVLKRSIETSSGNALFDSAVLNAIDKSSPLPKPPVEIQDAMKDGAEVTFTGRKG